jgi:hypothetical protein
MSIDNCQIFKLIMPADSRSNKYGTRKVRTFETRVYLVIWENKLGDLGKLLCVSH